MTRKGIEIINCLYVKTYGETMLVCVSVCSTLMEELWRGNLWRGILRPMGCWDAWPHQPGRM